MRSLLLARFVAIFTLSVLFFCLFLGVNNSSHLHFDENGQPHAHSHSTYADESRKTPTSHDNFDDASTLDFKKSDSHSHSHTQMHISFRWDWLQPNQGFKAKCHDFQKSRHVFMNHQVDEEMNRLSTFTKRFPLRDDKSHLKPHHILDMHVQKMRSIRLLI